MPALTRILVVILIIAISANLQAQNYEADSILYTPIPTQSVETVKRPLRPFRDTTQNQNLIRYFFNVNAGALTGCDNCTTDNSITFTASTVHGVTIGKKLRVGAGFGLDAYDGWQTLPFFGQLSYDLLGTRNTNALFVEAQYGWSHAWDNRAPQEIYLADVDGGAMAGAQIGYRIKYHELRIGLVFGIRRQFVSSYFEYPTFYVDATDQLVAGPSSTTTVEREMRRVMIAFQIGWK